MDLVLLAVPVPDIPKLFTDGIHSHFSWNTHALTHTPTHSWLPSLPQFHRFKHTPVRSRVEVYDATKEKKELVTVRDSCGSGGLGGGVLPTHTGPALPANRSWEIALVRPALPGRALGSLGLGRHQRIFLACADRGFHCSGVRLRKYLRKSSRMCSHWVQEMAPCCD